jgi:hypothetical protein
MPAQILVGVVADRVALERIRLVLLDRAIDLLDPAELPGAKMAWLSMRRVPASAFTFARAARPSGS